LQAPSYHHGKYFVQQEQSDIYN